MPETLELRPSDAENLAGQDTGRDHLSHSKLNTLLNCARKYELSYLERLEPIDRPRPLDLGKAFQCAIELRDPAAGAETLREHAAVTRDQAAEDRLQVEEVTVEAAAAAYLRRWPPDASEVREFEYRVRLRSPWTGFGSRTFDLLGYADGVIEHPDHLELVENKLWSKLDEVSIRRLKLDRQISLTCYGLWRATGKSVRVVHYRITRKPSIRQKKNETHREFLERLRADYEDPDRLDFYTHPESLFRSDEDLLEIEAELWTWAEQLRHQGRQRHYARNTSSCSLYGGCVFLDICVGDPDARSLYRVKPEREEVPA